MVELSITSMEGMGFEGSVRQMTDSVMFLSYSQGHI
jgi:hypothetical protein